jgi:hypothetical protein
MLIDRFNLPVKSERSKVQLRDGRTVYWCNACSSIRTVERAGSMLFSCTALVYSSFYVFSITRLYNSVDYRVKSKL